MDLVRPIRVDDTILASTNVSETETAWDAVTTFAEDAVVRRDINGQGRRWISKAGGNLNHDPALDTAFTYWADDGPTMPWRMYGTSATRQTQRADSIAVSLELPTTERVDSLWLGNLSGTAAHIVQTDPVDGVVYDETFDLISPSGITDWYDWFFEPIERKAELTVTDLLATYSGSTIDVTITEAGETVGCGALVMGQGKTLGNTQWGASFGIKDYSTFAETPFGDEEPVVRPYKKIATFTSNLPNDYVDELHTLLARYRGIPVLFIGYADMTVSAVWGLATFKIDVPGPARSFCSIDVRSRTQ